MSKITKKLLAAASLLLILMILVGSVFKAGFFASLERNLSSKLYHSRTFGDEIVVVAIDERSLSSEGLGAYNSWNTGYFAKALLEMEEGNPSAVYFDLLFASPSATLSENNAYELAQAYPNVTDFTKAVFNFFSSTHPNDQAFFSALQQSNNVFLLKRFEKEVGYNESTQAVKYENEVLPISLFEEAAETGFARVTSNSESTTTSMIFGIPRYFEDAETNTVEENVDFQLAEAYLGQPVGEVPLANGQMLINYAAKPYYWPTVSFSDVYKGLVSPTVFENKIVLVGATAAILQDRHFTPIDEVTPMPGVEIHANAIQTILDGAHLQDQGLADFLTQSAIALLAIILVSLFLPGWVGGILLLLSLFGFGYYAQWRFDHGTVVQLLTSTVSLVLAYLSVLLYRNFTEFAEKRKLKEAFGRYVSPELVSQITEHPEQLKLGGERRAITALFLDIENFTNLSEGLEPQAVVKVINDYFDALSKVIMSKGGTVDKFEGDAIMALFGAPVPSEDHGLKACETALAIQARMAELNAATGYKLNIRIGLATGDAIVGNMGSENRFDYTAMGDTVNTASRLEGANKFYTTRILVQQGTYEAAKDHFFFREVDSVCLKGKDNAIHIYELLGTLEGVSENGKKVVAQWDQALAAYRAGNWGAAEQGFNEVLKALPNDGPSSTLLGRLPALKNTAPGQWDGVWKFESK